MSRTGIIRALVISDGRPGHYNQSIALCRLLGVAFVVVGLPGVLVAVLVKMSPKVM